MSIITNFINGLKKSFDGKDYLRDINQCEICGKPSCSTKAAYKKSEEESKRKDQKW